MCGTTRPMLRVRTPRASVCRPPTAQAAGCPGRRLSVQRALWPDGHSRRAIGSANIFGELPTDPELTFDIQNVLSAKLRTYDQFTNATHSYYNQGKIILFGLPWKRSNPKVAFAPRSPAAHSARAVAREARRPFSFSARIAWRRRAIVAERRRKKTRDCPAPRPISAPAAAQSDRTVIGGIARRRSSP